MEPLMYNGVKIVATDFMCVWIQARTHKKARINKKWLKRYGYKRAPDMSTVRMADIPGMGKVLFCHPKLYERLKQALEEMVRANNPSVSLEADSSLCTREPLGADDEKEE